MADECVTAAEIAELARELVFNAEQRAREAAAQRITNLIAAAHREASRPAQGDLHEGPAKTADGELADMPRDLAHSLNSALFDAVALLYIARELAGDVADAGPDNFRDFDGIHCRGTRLVALLSAADDKVRAVCKRLEPYV